jgi:hypothetical protein
MSVVSVNVSPVKAYEASFADKITGRIKRLQNVQGIGWHLQFLSPGWLVRVDAVFKSLPVPFVIDHGALPSQGGYSNPGFQNCAFA